MEKLNPLHIKFNITLTKLLVLFTPIMFFNPMEPAFMRLQLSDFLALILIPATLFMAFKQRNFSISYVGTSILIFLIISLVASITSSNQASSYLELLKFIYLSIMAWSIWYNAVNLNIADDLTNWFSISFLLIIFGGIFGSIFFVFGYETFLVHSTKIIGVALGIENIIPSTPRITSFLKPTANMTAFYMATSLLLSVDYLFRRYQHSHNDLRRLIILLVISIVAFLTMSRGLIGVLLAIWLGIYFLRWGVPFRKTCLWMFGILILGSFFSLQMFTIFYPIDLSLTYMNDPHYQKEMVDLGTKVIPNPVYFLRDGIGSENITLSMTYAYNHYLWLKYAAFKIFQLNPYFGVGLGCYSIGVTDLSSAGVVSSELIQYTSSQSQLFTTIAETGLLGLISLILVIFSLALTSANFYKISKNNYSIVTLLSLLVCIVISLDADILSFRWLWVIFPILLALQARLFRQEV